MKIDKNDMFIITLFVVIIISTALVLRNICNDSKDTTLDDIESITPLNVDSIDTITFYCATGEVFVTMLNGDEHYCEVRVANALKYTKLGIDDTKFEVWENSDGETEIVINYE